MPIKNQNLWPRLNTEKIKNFIINAKSMAIKHFNIKRNRSALNILTQITIIIYIG